MRRWFCVVTIVTLLVFAACSVADDSVEDPPIVAAARKGDLKGVMKHGLIGDKAGREAEADRLNEKGKHGHTALMAAIVAGHTNIVKKLIQYGADPTIPDDEGLFPTHAAGLHGRADALEFLYHAGLRIRRSQLEDGLTPLHRACLGNEPRHTDTVRRLVTECEINIEETTADGRTCFDLTPNEETKGYILQIRAEREAAEKEAQGFNVPPLVDPDMPKYENDAEM